MFEKITQEEYQADLIKYIELSKEKLNEYLENLSTFLLPGSPEDYANLAILLDDDSPISKLMYSIYENTGLYEADKLSNGADVYYLNEDGVPAKMNPDSYELMISAYNDAIKMNKSPFDIEELNDTEGGINLPEYKPSKLNPEDQIAYL